MDVGEVRLVAWLEDEIPGVTIEPAAAQSRHVTLLIAHLQYGEPAAPERDQNTRAAVREVPADDGPSAFDTLPDDAVMPESE
jgi:hypothetical protein